MKGVTAEMNTECGIVFVGRRFSESAAHFTGHACSQSVTDTKRTAIFIGAQ